MSRKFKNTDPDMPWNDPDKRNDWSKPWNDLRYKNDPLALWNDLFADEKDYETYCRRNLISKWDR